MVSLNGSNVGNPTLGRSAMLLYASNHDGDLDCSLLLG